MLVVRRGLKPVAAATATYARCRAVDESSVILTAVLVPSGARVSEVAWTHAAAVTDQCASPKLAEYGMRFCPILRIGRAPLFTVTPAVATNSPAPTPCST